MGVTDIILLVVIISVAIYICYRSLWKKRGHCSGCDPAMCEKKGSGRGDK